MIIMRTVAFLALVAGCFIILNISPISLVEDILKLIKKIFQNKEQTLKSKIKEAMGLKKKRGIKKLVEETKEILKATGKENAFSSILILSLTLMTIGAFIAVIVDNIFLIPTLALGFSLIPFWYIKLASTKWKKGLNNELETALSVITTSYMRTESIITAIEENLNYINPPVYDVFKVFLTQTKLINSNIKLALENLKTKIDSAVFHEWVSAVIDCQEDKNLKSTLTPIVSKLSDMRIVSAELDYMLYAPVKEFISMVILLVANIPLMYFLNRDWFNTLVYTTTGKIVLAISAVVIFVSLAGVIRLSKPAEYKR
ncbi:MAG: type II secretion system F family protein [Alkaliphilus sp.]